MQALKDHLYRLLRWSERYTKTDMVYLASGGFWSIIGQLSASILTFILAIAMAHFVSKDAYGTYKYIISLVAILGTFSLTGLGSAVFQSVTQGFEGSLKEGFWANLRWSFAMFIGAFGLAAYYFVQGNAELAAGILACGCLSPFLASANLSQSYLAAKKDFKRLNIYFNLIENVIPIGALLATILFTQNPAIIAFVYFASNTFITYLLYRRTVRLYRPDVSKRDPGLFSYGGHLSVLGVLSGIANQIDQVLLFHFVGPVQLAIYNFAGAIPDQAKGPLKNLDRMMQARFADRTDTEIRAGMRNKTLWISLLSAAGVALYIILAPHIFNIFFPKYVDAVFFSQLYALMYLADGFNPAGSYLVVKKKVREQYVSTTSISILRIAALVIGVLFWGLLGVVIARIIVHFAGALLNYILFSFSARY